MDIVETEEFEEVGATYQCIEIQRLNHVLKENGITDKEIRKNICSEYIASAGYFIDDQSFESEGKRYTVNVCFEDGGGNLYVKNSQFDFHEYAYGNIEYFFEEQGETLDDVNIE